MKKTVVNDELDLITVINGISICIFENLHDKVRQFFQKKEAHTILNGENCNELVWPKEPGVYLVWQRVHDNKPELIYIGMTGKVKNGKLSSTPGLKARKLRWTPYFFDETKNCFCYQPVYDNRKKSGRPDKYLYEIDIRKIEVECFVFGQDLFNKNRIAPSFLEALLLQSYLIAHGHLPKVNQEF